MNDLFALEEDEPRPPPRKKTQSPSHWKAWLQKIAREAVRDVTSRIWKTPRRRERTLEQPGPYRWTYCSAEKEAPCEACGVITSDWMSYDGRTGLCKCNDCYQPERKAGIEAYQKFVSEGPSTASLQPAINAVDVSDNGTERASPQEEEAREQWVIDQFYRGSIYDDGVA